MANVTTDFYGLDRMTARLSSNNRTARKVALEKGKKVAVERCPVSADGPSHGSKHLWETIRITGVNQYADDLVAGDEEREHGPYVEFGTHKMPARPFMGPAADVVAASYPGEVARRIVS